MVKMEPIENELQLISPSIAETLSMPFIEHPDLDEGFQKTETTATESQDALGTQGSSNTKPPAQKVRVYPQFRSWRLHCSFKGPYKLFKPHESSH